VTTPEVSMLPQSKRKKRTAAERLQNLVDLRNQRSNLYGDNYVRAGIAMKVLFGKPLTLTSSLDHARYGLLTQVMSKLSRYAVQWETGDEGSLDDLSVYAQLLAEVDDDDSLRSR
jgi:hypothetical protein